MVSTEAGTSVDVEQDISINQVSSNGHRILFELFREQGIVLFQNQRVNGDNLGWSVVEDEIMTSRMKYYDADGDLVSPIMTHGIGVWDNLVNPLFHNGRTDRSIEIGRAVEDILRDGQNIVYRLVGYAVVNKNNITEFRNDLAKISDRVAVVVRKGNLDEINAVEMASAMLGQIISAFSLGYSEIYENTPDGIDEIIGRGHAKVIEMIHDEGIVLVQDEGDGWVEIIRPTIILSDFAVNLNGGTSMVMGSRFAVAVWNELVFPLLSNSGYDVPVAMQFQITTCFDDYPDIINNINGLAENLPVEAEEFYLSLKQLNKHLLSASKLGLVNNSDIEIVRNGITPFMGILAMNFDKEF